MNSVSFRLLDTRTFPKDDIQYLFLTTSHLHRGKDVLIKSSEIDPELVKKCCQGCHHGRKQNEVRIGTHTVKRYWILVSKEADLKHIIEQKFASEPFQHYYRAL